MAHTDIRVGLEAQYKEKPKGMVLSLIDWLHEKGIYELAVTRMTALEKKQQNVMDSTFVLSENLTDIVRAIKTLAMKQADAEEDMLVTVGSQAG
jgi:hypothetical protein